MRAWSFGILVGLSSCAPEGDARLDARSATSAIIYGAACASGPADAAVGLLVDARVNFGDGLQDLETLLCSAVRVAPDVVLTAAHCVDLEAQGATFVESATWSVSSAADLRAVFEQTAPLQEDRVPVVEVHVPAAFDPASFVSASGLSSEADVAVLVLGGQLAGPDVFVAAPSEASLSPPAPLELVGYGSTDPAGAVTGAVGRRRCVSSFVSQLTDDELKVGLGETSGRRCVVDSGGPSFAAVDDGVRVVSLGSRAWDTDTGCAGGHVETRLDAWWTFIDEVMRDACARGVRTSCAEPGLPRPPEGDAGSGDVDGGRADAGALDAGAEDAGAEDADASSVDADVDAGVDAGAATEDAGQDGLVDAGAAGARDAGDIDGGAAPGCTCAGAPEGKAPHGGGLVLVALLSLWARFRRPPTARAPYPPEQR